MVRCNGLSSHLVAEEVSSYYQAMLESSSSDEEYDDHGGQVGRDVSDYHAHPHPQYGNISQHSIAIPSNSNQSHQSQHSTGYNNRDSGGSGIYGGSHGQQPSNSTRSNHSGSSGSPASTSRAPSFENTKIAGSSFDTVSISSGLSVPAAGGYDTRSHDGSVHNTPSRHERHSGGHSRSSSFRGPDRSPQPMRRSASPTSSIISEREREELERLNFEEKERRTRLQIYVFVLRCIAFPFNAEQKPNPSLPKRQAKVNKQELNKVKERFSAFIDGQTSIMADEAFKNAVQSYFEVFLMSDRVSSMVRSGGCSNEDFRDVFKNNIEKRVRSLPEIDGLAKETVLSSWMTKFDNIYRGEDNRKVQRPSTTANELILSKDQLYEMFQNIFNIKKYEHLILYNALQVHSLL